jgi:hypothetical protein
MYKNKHKYTEISKVKVLENYSLVKNKNKKNTNYIKVKGKNWFQHEQQHYGGLLYEAKKTYQ